MNFSVSDRAGDALALMERALRGGEPLAPEYPLVFSEAGTGRFVVASDEQGVASTCAILERELVVPGGRLRAGLIGAVSTDEAHRGRGLASTVLERAEAALAASGCSFSILWADDSSFYAKRGYREVGTEIDYGLPAELAQSLPKEDGVRPAIEADFRRMHELYSGHDRRVDRSQVESCALFRTPGMQIHVRESHGVVDAYACYERGGDLARVVHEWAGEPEGVLACTRPWLEELQSVGGEEALYLMAPASAGELGRRLDQLGAPSAPGVLGMAKLLDPEALLDELCLSASEPLTFDALGPWAWSVHGPGGSVELAKDQLLGLVLAPRGDRTEIARVENLLGVQLPGLPRTPFFWGLDSI